MGFRSYVRHFCGAISKLFRPSLPWGFAAGSGSLLGVAASHQQKLQQQEKKVAKIITSVSMGFRSYVRRRSETPAAATGASPGAGEKSS